MEAGDDTSAPPNTIYFIKFTTHTAPPAIHIRPPGLDSVRLHTPKQLAITASLTAGAIMHLAEAAEPKRLSLSAADMVYECGDAEHSHCVVVSVW